ncbi:MAG: hypothetical protein K2F59_02810 [Eubacteriales bacterium]|nr:hypothetical protein [Eubacteriales bacterium]
MLNNINNQTISNSYAKYPAKKEGKSSEINSKNEDTAVVYSKSKANSEAKETSSTSSYERKSSINHMLSQAELQAKNFETLISSTFQKQSNKALLASYVGKNNLKGFFSNLKVDAATVAKAQNDISEDGYYGVEQTSDRILSFAKAIAGNDPKKLEEMRKAVEKGFNQVEKMWGGKLPEVSQKTYEKVMSTFDEWQKNTL